MTVAFKSAKGKEEVLKYYDMLLTKGSLPHEKISVNTSYGKTFIIAMGEKELPHS